MTTSLVERFWSRVETPVTGCWTWTGTLNHRGYGVLGRGGRGEGNVLVHRLSWELTRGEIPNGFAVMHRCDNPPCVRPDHLEPGTWGDNNRDMTRKGRHGRTGSPGEKHPMARLTRDAVSVIRASSESSTALARRFGVSRCAVADVRHGRTWR